MKNEQYQYTYGKPVETSIFLVAYSLGWLGIFIYFVLTSGGGCSLTWIMIIPFLGLLLTTALLLVVGISMVVRYIRRIKYLKSRGMEIPRSYFVTLSLLPIALLTQLWIIPVINPIVSMSASSKMNNVEEFRELAENCNVKSVGTYYNNTFHRAEDADAYVQVQSVDYDVLYYPRTQKDELHQIYQSYADKCAEQIQENQSSNYSYANPYYYQVNWDNAIHEYSTSC